MHTLAAVVLSQEMNRLTFLALLAAAAALMASPGEAQPVARLPDVRAEESRGPDDQPSASRRAGGSQQPAQAQEDDAEGRVGVELVLTAGGSVATLAAAVGIGAGASVGCRGWDCARGTLAGGLVAVPGILFFSPYLTDVAGRQRGSYWAAVAGSAVGTTVGVLAASPLFEAADSDNAALFVTLGVGLALGVQVGSTVLAYELSAPTRPSPSPSSTSWWSVAPALSATFKGLTVAGQY